MLNLELAQVYIPYKHNIRASPLTVSFPNPNASKKSGSFLLALTPEHVVASMSSRLLASLQNLGRIQEHTGSSAAKRRN